MEKDFLISTLDNIPNYAIVKTEGLFYVQDRCDFINEALSKLKKIALEKGCNALINVKLLPFVQGENGEYLSYHAYGEAVIIKKNR